MAGAVPGNRFRVKGSIEFLSAGKQAAYFCVGQISADHVLDLRQFCPYAVNIAYGTLNFRPAQLRKREDITIEELAAKIGVNATTLGRIEKGQTQKIGSDVLVAIAREFNVSTDFLLGLTNIPERKNYEVGELGLSAQAVRNLYTRKVNPDVVNRLLEHPRFALLSAMIAQYLDDTFAEGVAVQNQIFASMSELLLGEGQKEAAQAVNLLKVPPYQVELTKMQAMFTTMLKEMKHYRSI